MSYCKDCTEHPDGFLKCCYHVCDQFTDNEGNVKSRLLSCPKFKPISGENSWKQFLDGKYDISTQ